MKVKISYTIPFEEVPRAIEGLLGQANNQLELISRLLLSVSPSTNTNLDKHLESLENARQSLVDVDMRIKECYSILYGFQKTKMDMRQSQPDEEFNAG